MFAVVGTLLLATAVVVLAWAQLLYRQPKPPRWTEWEFPAVTVTLAILSLFALGIALLGQFVVTVNQQHLTQLDVALIALIIFGAVIAATSLRGRLARLHVTNREEAGTSAVAIRAHALSNTSGTEPSSNQPPRAPARGKRSRRRRAA